MSQEHGHNTGSACPFHVVPVSPTQNIANQLGTDLFCKPLAVSFLTMGNHAEKGRYTAWQGEVVSEGLTKMAFSTRGCLRSLPVSADYLRQKIMLPEPGIAYTA